MAKLIEDALTLKFSKLVKDSDEQSPIITEELLLNIETIIQELVGDSIIVEIE